MIGLWLCAGLLVAIVSVVWFRWWRHSTWGGRIERLFLTLVMGAEIAGLFLIGKGAVH